MSITYEEALSTLQAMFGPPWTEEKLDLILRHYKGHMENTVESILGHGDKEPEALIEKLNSSVADTSMDEQLARALSQKELSGANNVQSRAGRQGTAMSSSEGEGGGGAAIAAVASAGRKGRGTPTDLPDDFLRAPRENNQVGTKSGNSGNEQQQLVSDEALARMMQDELFSQELARNPDFAHIAGRGNGATSQPRSRATTSQQGMASAGGIFHARNQAMNQNQADLPSVPEIMDKISVLGNNARRSLSTMAAQFKARTNDAMNNARGVGPNVDQNNTGGYGNYAETRGLLDEDTDQMELAARKDL